MSSFSLYSCCGFFPSRWKYGKKRCNLSNRSCSSICFSFDFNFVTGTNPLTSRCSAIVSRELSACLLHLLCGLMNLQMKLWSFYYHNVANGNCVAQKKQMKARNIQKSVFARVCVRLCVNEKEHSMRKNKSQERRQFSSVKSIRLEMCLFAFELVAMPMPDLVIVKIFPSNRRYLFVTHEHWTHSHICHLYYTLCEMKPLKIAFHSKETDWSKMPTEVVCSEISWTIQGKYAQMQREAIELKLTSKRKKK